MINKTTYICTLPESQITEIKNRLNEIVGSTPENIDNMLDGRICDMEEVLSFEEVKKILKVK